MNEDNTRRRSRTTAATTKTITTTEEEQGNYQRIPSYTEQIIIMIVKRQNYRYHTSPSSSSTLAVEGKPCKCLPRKH